MSRLRLTKIKYSVDIYYNIDGEIRVKYLNQVYMENIDGIKKSGLFEDSTWIPPHKIEKIVFHGGV